MSVYQFEVMDNLGEKVALNQYRGKVILIVNTASRCGFTPQYKDLQELSQLYKDDLIVLGFPCNQFGQQEPGSDSEILEFCSLNFKVKFPLFKKIDVNGDSAEPLFEYLKEAAPGLMGSKKIKWNFTKFLVNREGIPTGRFAPQLKPKDLIKHIEELL